MRLAVARECFGGATDGRVCNPGCNAESTPAPDLTANSSRCYTARQLQRCVENGDRYILLVRWRALEDHTVGFRQSNAYQEWKALLHRFYEPFPVVEQYSLTEIA